MQHKCPVCGEGVLERKATEQTFNYQGQKLKYQQPREWCSSCDEGILHSSDMQATELLLSDFRAKVDGYLTITDIRRIRNKLKLTQKNASSIFGGGITLLVAMKEGFLASLRQLIIFCDYSIVILIC